MLNQWITRADCWFEKWMLLKSQLFLFSNNLRVWLFRRAFPPGPPPPGPLNNALEGSTWASDENVGEIQFVARKPPLETEKDFWLSDSKGTAGSNFHPSLCHCGVNISSEFGAENRAPASTIGPCLELCPRLATNCYMTFCDPFHLFGLSFPVLSMEG